MKNIIGYPEEISDLNFVDKYYENVRLTPNNYYENARRLKKAVYLSSINDLKKTPDESCWIEFALAASVNVHYNRIYNAIGIILHFCVVIIKSFYSFSLNI